MKLFLSVKPGAKQNRVEKMDETHFKIWVKAPPAEGRANEAVLRLLADFLKVPKSRIEFLRGTASKQKIVEIN